jgi:phosphosulfolactate synthase (CoM biosynthesis protein A)
MLKRFAIDIDLDKGGTVGVIILGEQDAKTFFQRAEKLGLHPAQPIEVSEATACRMRMSRSPEHEDWVQKIIEKIFPAPEAPF